MNKTMINYVVGALVFVGMFVVGMQFDFSRQAMVVYESLQSDNGTQKAQIGNR